MIKNRTLAMVLCLLFCIGTIMTSCGSTNESNNAEPTTNTDVASQRGMIESIDTTSNQVTIRVMGGFFNGSPDFNPGENSEWPKNGERPEMPDGAKKPDGAEKPNRDEMPNKDEMPNRDEMPDGAKFPDGAKIPEGVPGGVTSQTYSISDETVITDKDGKSITLADLSENAFATFTEKDGVILTLSISQFDGKSERMTPPDDSSSKSSGNSADNQ